MRSSIKYLLSRQYYLGWISAFILGPLIYLLIRLAGYRIRNLRQIRKHCRINFKTHKGPWIICANHLTMIDSIILVYLMAPFYHYLLNYRVLPWDLPERANFKKNALLTILTYLTKCIPVSRGGDSTETKSVLEDCIYLLRNKQPVLIFPEGGRSRSGRIDVDNFSYGVGYIIRNCEQTKVMCIYLRGDHQDSYSTLPRWGERFTATTEVMEPADNGLSGLRAQRNYAEQVITCLAKMEGSYFALRECNNRVYSKTKEKKTESQPPLHEAHPRSQ